MKILGTLLAVSCLASVCMVFLSIRAGHINNALLFFGFAMLLGLPSFACFRRWDTGCAIDAEADNAASQAPVRFVPHRFLMTALILTAAAILAAIIVPLVFR